MLNLLECRKPLIVTVAGAEVGIGTTMLLHFTQRLRSPEAVVALAGFLSR